MNMRTIYFQPRIYGHRLKTLMEENGLDENESAFMSLYEELITGLETVAYYEYDLPARSYITAVLSSRREELFSEKSLSFNEKKAARVISAELFNETLRLFGEWISREKRSSLGSPEYKTDKQKDEALKELYSRWERLPKELAAKDCLPFGTCVFTSKLGLRLGCSGGGSCSSCTHPTCGYRST